MGRGLNEGTGMMEGERGVDQEVCLGLGWRWNQKCQNNIRTHRIVPRWEMVGIETREGHDIGGKGPEEEFYIVNTEYRLTWQGGCYSDLLREMCVDSQAGTRYQLLS